mmetsp:Transcript_50982/g.143299  ORF Transcript_50982/g.143299 Transcript_50982/m.143299 type:complete len:311 (+) Transcript_50982:149-1081(+)
MVGVCCRTGVGAAGMVEPPFTPPAETIRDGVPSRGVIGGTGIVALELAMWPPGFGDPDARTLLPQLQLCPTKWLSCQLPIAADELFVRTPPLPVLPALPPLFDLPSGALTCAMAAPKPALPTGTCGAGDSARPPFIGERRCCTGVDACATWTGMQPMAATTVPGVAMADALPRWPGPMAALDLNFGDMNGEATCGALGDRARAAAEGGIATMLGCTPGPMAAKRPPLCELAAGSPARPGAGEAMPILGAAMGSAPWGMPPPLAQPHGTGDKARTTRGPHGPGGVGTTPSTPAPVMVTTHAEEALAADAGP